MSISFAGIPLTPLHAHQEIAAQFWHSHRIDEFDYTAYFTPKIQHLPGLYPPHRTPPRIGCLYWPTGAHTWAVCHLVATGEQVAAIRTAIGNTPTAKTLSITDGFGNTINPLMYLLRPLPIHQKGVNEWYLLTLVDQRFYWHQSGNSAAPTSPATWTALLTNLFAAVGVTPTIGTIAAAYLTPNAARWSVGTQSIPLLIDAVCRQVGMRVVRQLDGTVAVVSYASAASADTTRWAAIRDLVLAGGRLTAPDLGRMVPASVDTVFFDGTATNTTLASLALTAFGGVNGVAIGRGRVTADPATPTASQRTAYATQAATDYYNWALSLTDCTLRSIQNITLTGLDEFVEWIHHPEALLTRVVRPPLSDANVYGESSPGADESSLTGTAPEYQDECVNGSLVRKRATLTLGTSGLTQTSYVYETVLGIPCVGGLSGSGLGGLGGSSGLGPVPNPAGEILNAVTAVCPSPCGDAVGDVIIKLTSTSNSMCFLKADGSTVSRTVYAELFAVYGTTFGVGDSSTTFTLPTVANPVTGLSYFVRAGNPNPYLTRQMIRVPIADVRGCIQNQENCCDTTAGSGSGGTVCGVSECVLDCDICLLGMSSRWQLTISGLLPIELCHVDAPADDNYCRFSSVDLTWDLRYEYGDALWVLTNLDDGRVWYTNPQSWACLSANTMLAVDAGEANAIVTPVYNCAVVSYNCVSGGCVGVAGTGGTYATLAACEAACTGGGTVDTTCCPLNLLPSVLNVVVSGETGDCASLPDTFTMSYNGGGIWGSDAPIAGNLYLVCAGGGWTMYGAGPCAGTVSTNPTSAACNPFRLVFADKTMAGCCTGTATFVITR